MQTKERLRQRLQTVRAFTETLLKDFRKPEEWIHQVHPDSNHALWFAGHMGVTDDFFLSLIAPQHAVGREDMRQMFGAGSHPSTSLDDYPSPEEVTAFMHDRRAALIAFLEELEEDDFGKKTPDGAPEFLPDFVSVFETAIWHEGLHSGQLSVARRALGNQPIR